MARIPADQLLQAPAVQTQPSWKGRERPEIGTGLERSGSSWGGTGAFVKGVSEKSGLTLNSIMPQREIMTSFLVLEAQETQTGAGVLFGDQ